MRGASAAPLPLHWDCGPGLCNGGFVTCCHLHLGFVTCCHLGGFAICIGAVDLATCIGAVDLATSEALSITP